MADFLGIPIDYRLLLVIAAACVGGFMRGFLGFGAALVMMPILALVFGPVVAAGVYTIVSLPTVVQLLPTALKQSERGIILPMAVGTFATAPFGALALVSFDPSLMKIYISVAVLIMVLMLAQGWKLAGKVNLGVLLAAGAVGGLVQGSTSMGGPPVAAIALSRPGTAQQQRANVIAVLAAVFCSSLIPFWYFGMFTREAMVAGLLLIPFYLGLSLLGSRYFSHSGHKFYRIAALTTLAVVGIVTLAAAVRDYFQALG
ncbi:MAG: hypothetical protein RLZ98_162 [Pseudomonadota bacterium]